MKYELLVGEPWDFEGLDGKNKILVDGLGIVNVIDDNGHSKELYLLQVLHPFVMDKQKVDFLVFQPRHAGDTIYEIAQIGGVVGVYRVKEGVLAQNEQQLSVNDLAYCIIGHLSILSA
jgi:hypothetical protein